MSSQELPNTMQPTEIAEQDIPQEERNSQQEPSYSEHEGQEQPARPTASKSDAPSSDAVLPSSPSPTKTEHLRAEPDINELKRKSTTEHEGDNNNSQAQPSTTTLDQQPATENPRLTALQSKLTSLQSHLSSLQTQHSTLVSTLPLPSGLAPPPDQTPAQALQNANAVIKEHIALLHSYNEIKDIGMGLMGLVADKRGVRVKVVMEEFGMGAGD